MKPFVILLLLNLLSFSSLASSIVENDETPALRCSKHIFALPDTPIMHKIKTNSNLISLELDNLPTGLFWNEKRNLVEGKISDEGEYSYNVRLISNGDTITETIKLTVNQNIQHPTPIMGWLSWNVVEGDISQKVVEETADAMVSKGLKQAGYNYLVIDDLWQSEKRDSITGRPLADETKFPHGMKAVSDYVHNKGLNFGIYSCAGDKTCAGRYGSYGYEEIDAHTYADWEVDLLKYDYCNVGEATDRESAFTRYKAMGNALKNTGKNITLYMCEWGVRNPWEWGEETGSTLWRCTFDTRDGWNGIKGGVGLLQSIEEMKNLWPYSGVNRFNDADMLCVGIHGKGKSSSHLVEKAGMSDEEYATQFIMWCMWSSPLFLSFDIREPIEETDLNLITNPELIALNQDPLGQQAEFIMESDDKIQLYVKDLVNENFAVALVNLDEKDHSFIMRAEDFEPYKAGYKYQIRDLKELMDLGKYNGEKEIQIKPHETKIYRFDRITN